MEEEALRVGFPEGEPLGDGPGVRGSPGYPQQGHRQARGRRRGQQ